MPAPRQPAKDTSVADFARWLKSLDRESIMRAIDSFDPDLAAASQFDPSGIPPHRQAEAWRNVGGRSTEALSRYIPFTPLMLAHAIEDKDAGALPEMLSAQALLPPAGKIAMRLGQQGARNALARAAIGPSRGLSGQASAGLTIPAAMGAGAANAGEAPPVPERKDIATVEPAEAEPSDPRYQALVDAQRSAQETVAALRASVSKEAETGFGDKSAAAAEALAAAEQRLQETTDALTSYVSPEQQTANAERHQSNRNTALGVGAGTGLTAALIYGLAGRGMRGGQVRKLNALAKQIEGINAPTATARIIGTKQGDDLTSLVNEAYRTGEGRMPFARTRGGQTPKRGPLGRRVPDDDIFGPRSGSLPGETLLPGMAMAEGAGALSYGIGAVPGAPPPGPEEASFWQNQGAGAMMGALAFKGGRKLGKMALPKGEPAARASVNAARTRLEREMTPLSPRQARQETEAIGAARRLQQARTNATQPLVPNPADILPPEPPRPQPKPSIRQRAQVSLSSGGARRPANPGEDVDLEEALKELQRAIDRR